MRVALYGRVSTGEQTTANQFEELRAVGERLGWEVVAVFEDAGISGAKGRDQRPGFDALMRGVARKDFDLIATWSVDRLGRSLPDLIGFLSEIQSRGVGLYLHRQGVDTTTPSGRLLFQMLGVFAEFERAIIRDRVVAGLNRARSEGTRLGRPPLPPIRLDKIRKALAEGQGVRETARRFGVSPTSVSRIRRDWLAECGSTRSD